MPGSLGQIRAMSITTGVTAALSNRDLGSLWFDSKGGYEQLEDIFEILRDFVRELEQQTY